jgi:hypothetical protein
MAGDTPSDPSAFEPWMFDHDDQCWMQLGPAIDQHRLLPGAVCSRSWRYRVAHKLPKERIGRLQEAGQPNAHDLPARSWLARQAWWNLRPLFGALVVNAACALVFTVLLVLAPHSRNQTA